MRLSCADFTFPKLDHRRALDVIARLGVGAVDLGFMGNRSHVRPEVVRGDVAMWAGRLEERLAGRGLALADLFLIPWNDYHRWAVNHPDPAQRQESRALFEVALELAQRLRAPGITILPGMVYGDESREDALARSAEGLRQRVELAGTHGVPLSVEGHVGSVADSPERLGQLLSLVPGLRLTLDYAHFTCQGVPDAEIDPLLVHARHLHLRGAATGKLQASLADNAVDFGRVIERLREIGYAGYLCLEYVAEGGPGLEAVDNVSETILLRDLVLGTGARSPQPDCADRP